MTDLEIEPPVPVQLSENVVLLVKAPVDSEPLVATFPDHPPEAMQLVAFVLLQVKVELPPPATLVGFAFNISVGAAGVVMTATVTDCEIEPLPPEQLRVNVLSLVSAPVDCDPLVVFVPDHAPEAVQLVTFVVSQLRVEALPLVTLVGFAVSVNVGSDGGETDAVTVCDVVPPAPVQLSEKKLVTFKGADVSVPEVGFAPFHAPEAVQLVASLLDQSSLTVLPATTVVGVALNRSVGAGGGGAAPNTIDFICQPSPPPELMLQASTLPPPTAPKQTPTSPVSGICGFVVHFAPGQTEMS